VIVPAAKPFSVPAKPARVAAPQPLQPVQPLNVATRVGGVDVHGSLSAAQLRRGMERIRPGLTECYGEAARRAGVNQPASVRVAVTIDEAGRVKAQPKVEGAELPGLGECLTSALSKLVCQAPDTGTAKASLVLGFGPER
jgi:hypothetical protein